MALLTVENVRKSYAGQLVLDDISFQVAQGECVALLGPSGCGKSTLLNIIAGFLGADSGKIISGGIDIVRTPPHKRNMGMVFQDYALFPHLNVIENLEFGARMRRVPARERRGPALAALDLVGLSGLENRSIRQLSGGQQQRVAVARALVNEPKLMLFDEPLSNLDARMRETMRSDIRALLDRTKISAIFVTHDQAEAFAIADRVAVMNKGRLEQIGKADELYERPSTQFVASFLGGCNLIPGTVTAGAGADDRLTVSTGVGDLAAIGGQASLVRQGAKVTLAVRPHHVVLTSSAGTARSIEGGQNSIDCRIEFIEYLGAFSRVTIKHPNGQAFMAEVDGRPSYKPGDAATASWGRQHTWPMLNSDGA